VKVLLLVVLATLATACGVRPSVVIEGGPAPTVDERVVDTLYFVNEGKLTLVERPTVGSTSALVQLTGGPTEVEKAAGLTTELPPAISVAVTMDLQGILLTLNTGVSGLSQMAVDQLTCTAAKVKEVTLTGAGETRGPEICPFEG
jgi:hypothetical protein